MPEIVIADISKAFPNTNQQALEAVRTYCSSNTVELTNITIVARPDQVGGQREFPPPTSWVFTQDPAGAPALVAQLLQRLCGTSNGVMLLSFNTDVWRLSRQQWPGLQVRAQHVFGPPRNAQAATGQSLTPFNIEGPEPAWTFEHVAGLSEALDTLQRVLESRGAVSSATCLRQTVLRPWMGILNPGRFSGSAVSTNSSGMIGLLLRIAAVRGMVHLAGTNPGDLFVWLKRDAVSSQLELRSASQSQEEGEQCGEPVVPPVVMSEQASLELQATSGRRLTKKRLRQPDKYVCDRMSESIDQQRMGPFPLARPYVYDAIQDCVQAGGKLPFSSLVEAATQRAQKAMEQAACGGQPWTAIRFVTQRQLLRAGAVLDGDRRTLPNSWASGKVTVHDMVPDWRIRAEGEILLALFTVQEVTGDQLVDVARSVWGSSSAAALSNVLRVMEYLVESGRVQEDERGIFRVKRSHGGEPAAAPASTTPNVAAPPRQEARHEDHRDDTDESVH